MWRRWMNSRWPQAWGSGEGGATGDEADAGAENESGLAVKVVALGPP
jgi:hypothetical protein